MEREEVINISKLRLSLSNPRCIAVDDENEAIEEMLYDQGGDKVNNKILALARDIAGRGLNPSELLVVKPDANDDFFTVKEGNRRVTAIKCINNPAIIPDGFPRLRIEFANMHCLPIRDAKCYVIDDEDRINSIISSRHNGQSGGKGVVPWNSEQRARFDEIVSGKKDKVVQLIDYFLNFFGINSKEARWLNECKKTNIERLFSSPYVREKLGVQSTDSEYVFINPDEAVLSHLLYCLSIANVKDIYFAKDRESFINKVFADVGQISEIGQPDLGISGTDPKTEEVRDPSAIKDFNPRPKGHCSQRKTVIPREGCPLSTQGQAHLAQIVKELRSISVEEAPLACALLFRSFLEIAVDLYLSKKGNLTEKSSRALSARIQQACNELVCDKDCGMQNNDVDYLRKFAQNKDDLPVTLSSLNSATHSNSGWPDPVSLVILWDKTCKAIEAMLFCITKEGKSL